MSKPVSSLARTEPEFEVLIIGTGFSGLCMAIRLKKAGIHSFVALEKAREVGGVWRDNEYPGCACDVGSHLYSFSFAPNPEWSRKFSSQPEIFAYLKNCADKYGLRPHIRLNTEMIEAVYDGSGDFWRVRTRDGKIFTARSVVSGMGGLNRPAYPKIPGLESFAGVSFHSSEWLHDYDLKGKVVGVIGTGASAIQFVPEIAPKVERLYLFQRTPPWVLPKPDRPFSEFERKRFRWFPLYRWAFRKLIYWRNEYNARGFLNPEFMESAGVEVRKYLEKAVPDPELRAKVTPDYLIGCKRILLANNYYPALARPNVDLVTDLIQEIRPHSVVTKDGVERKVDALIYGTGFRGTDRLSPARVIGRDGVCLNDAWRIGNKAYLEGYLGVAVAGYPNWFMLAGPNSGAGHTSLVFIIEAQVNYIMKCIRILRNRKMRAIEVKQEAQDAFNRELHERLSKTVWATGCTSRYLDEQGKNTILWPGFTFQYWARIRTVNESDYEMTATGWPAVNKAAD